MLFTIESYKHLLGLKNGYRLKNDGSWKLQDDFHSYDIIADMLFDTYKSAELWVGSNPSIYINDSKVDIEPFQHNYESDTGRYFYEIVVHRIHKPKHQFTKDEIRQVLIDGDDSVSNSLIIDYDGYPMLVQWKDGCNPKVMRNYAVRHETFDAGNGYVGLKDNMRHLNEAYMSLLEGWLIHLQCGRSMYRDYCENRLSEQQLLSKINSIVNTLK